MSTFLAMHTNVIESSVEVLKSLLSETYVIYVKTQNFHWNVEGENFYSIHKMLEGQYDELGEGIDEIAERMRYFKMRALGSMAEFISHSSIIEEQNHFMTCKEMMISLVKDHESIISHIRGYIKKLESLKDDHLDDGTIDLLIRRVQYHEKTAWMLRSSI